MRTAIALTLVLAGLVPAAASAADPPAAGGVRESLLYVQTATSGTYRHGTLTLHGVGANVAWFSDRPFRQSGTASLGDMRKGLFSGGQPAPNAALDLAGHGLRGIAALELRRGRYDARTRTMTYRVKRLPSLERPGLRHLSDNVTAGGIPRRFGTASLFVDDAFDGNTCQVSIVNASGAPIMTTAESKWDSDHWDPAMPNSFGLPNGQPWRWGSTGSAFRGCHNTVTWQLYDTASGTITIDVTNPWSGSMTKDCTSSNPAYTCRMVSDNSAGMILDVTWTISPA
jgi:hypothetical protein